MLGRLVFGAMAAQLVGSAARMRIADTFGDEGRTVASVAAERGTQHEATHRYLRALSAIGVLDETSEGTYAITPLGALLRSGGEGSMRALSDVFTHPLILEGWQHLPESLSDGATAFDRIHGEAFFDHLKRDPDLSASFHASMADGTRGTAAVLADHYDFTAVTTVVDVGGGNGTLLSAVLDRHPHLNGVLFDTAEGLAGAPETLEKAGVAERCTTAEGDFFRGVPHSGDVYLLKSVVHDWDDARAAAILTHCRDAMDGEGRLVLIEPVLPDRTADAVSPVPYLSDLNMLLNVGGRERTRSDFADLCERAGFTMTDARPLPSGYHLVTAVPA